MKNKRQIDWDHFISGGGLLFLVLAVICIVGAGFTLSNSSGINAWPSTRGIVTMSYVSSGIPGSHQGSRYNFAYEYQVDGKTYWSDRYAYASVGGDQTVGVERYKDGDPVTVYYNPRDPSSAALVRQRPGLSAYIVLGFGFAFLLAAISNLLTGEALSLFFRSGWIELWEQLTNRRERAIERLRKVDARDDPEALANALQDPLLRECLHILTDTAYPYISNLEGFIKQERATHYIHEETGIEFDTAVEMVRILAQRHGIDLSVSRKSL